MKALDDTLKGIILEVQQELREEDGIELSVQEIYEIWHSQFRVANLAFKKGLEIRLPVFGKFIHTDSVNVFKKVRRFQEDNKHLSPEEYQTKLKEFKILLADEDKERSKTRNKKETNETLEDIKNTPDIVKVANVYDKYL